jgi:hypothetical protein
VLSIQAGENPRIVAEKMKSFLHSEQKQLLEERRKRGYVYEQQAVRKMMRPEQDKSDLWLLTYSDMVTLCLTFFVLLYSFSTIDTVKWKSLVVSMSGCFRCNAR